jgi:hypothetical protein
MKTIKNGFAIVLFAAAFSQIHTAAAEPGNKPGQAPAADIDASAAQAPELPLLRREAGSLASAASALKAAFCEQGCRTERLDDGVRLRGGAFRLDVLGDGSSVDFLDSGVSSRAHSLGRDTSQRPSADALEAAGREIVESKLADVIQLAPGEELYRAGVDYRTEWGQATTPGAQPTTAWTGSRVLFGRKIRGVPVVGGGSTIAVTFATDGSLEAIHYDWASYTVTAETKPLLPMGNILSLVQAAVAERTGKPAGATPVLPPSKANPGPIDLSPTAQLQKLECGFYDPGQLSRDAAAPVQAACQYHAVSFEVAADTTVRTGYAGAVPASSEVLPDGRWPEAAALTGAQMSAPAPARRSDAPSP